VPIALMDGTQRAFAFDGRDHQPHYARPTDAACERLRTEARDEMIRRLCDAWKSQPRDQAPDDDPDEDDPSAAANAVERQLERGRGREPVDVARAVEMRRRAQHAEFAQQLSNAWRGGR
jgi:hypothetical protein